MTFNRTYHTRARQSTRDEFASVQEILEELNQRALQRRRRRRTPLQGQQLELFETNADPGTGRSDVARGIGSPVDPDRPLFDLFPEAFE